MSDRPAAVAEACRVQPGGPFRLGDVSTRHETLFTEKDEAKLSARQDAKIIDRLQDRLYAERTRALLVIFQGTDTAGKSGAIKSAFGRTSPVGVRVKAFKPPSREERAHDFLWRVHREVPPRGSIGVFDRSHYEDVLVPSARETEAPATIEQRYRQINDFERMLIENGTTVLKIFLHVSKEQQASRLQERLDKAHKRWKFSRSDLADRDRWDGYQRAYETMIERCSLEGAPWHVVPADVKSQRNAIVASLVRHALEVMNPQYPEVAFDEKPVVR